MSINIEKDIEEPEYHKHEEFINRSKKLKDIREVGIDPYPYKYLPTHTIGQIIEKFSKKDLGSSDDAASGSTENVKIAGRLILFRPMGKNIFLQLQDETGRVQVMFNRDNTKLEGLDLEKAPSFSSHLKFLEKKLDLGDFIGVEGNLFKTQKGELTIFAKNVTILTKTLLPLPDKHSGLVDKGVRYRKRWLDLIAKKEVLDIFVLRSKIIRLVREYMDNAGFLEVETPILQNVYGGAEARPFKTNLHALHQDMFLRISLEIPLKKLLVGGFLKVYELGKVFRNEGIDKTHNPEFTELEGYAAYWDYNDLMGFVENLYEMVAIKLFNSTKVNIDEKTIDLKTPWTRISMKDSLKKYSDIDVDKLDDNKLSLLIRKKDPSFEGKNKKRGDLIAALFEEYVEEKLIQPHHITDHPIETTPLCKLHRDPKKRKEMIVERFETFILGNEMCNAYSELNDPIMQRKLLEQQSSLKGEDAPPLDEDFIESICQGMPPAGGFGIGIDRMVMLFLKASSIRDVLFFPLMKGEEL